MGTCNQSIWSNIELGMIKIILEMFGIFCRKGEESSSDFFWRLYFCAVPRVSRKTGTERLLEWTGEACPHGEGCSGRVARLPEGFGNIQKPAFY
jgi:hypothetical protein